MNTVTLNNLIDSIRNLLAGRPASGSVELVAHEYAQQCRVVNERLQRIAPILDGGGEIQALELANQPPQVMDLAATLSFGDEIRWQEYCQMNGHEVAPVIDARTLEALQEILNKGVSHNHPLYKVYRAAISSGDEAKAYETIQIITRLNPGDENAAMEKKRLEKKSLKAALMELRTAIAAMRDDEVLAIMLRVDQFRMAETYENLPEWQSAVAIRHAREREDARRRMPDLLLQAEQELAYGNWRQAAVSHGEFTLLFETYGAGSQAAAMMERSKVMEGELEIHRAEAKRLGQVKQLVAEMLEIGEKVEALAVTPLGIRAEFAGPLLDVLGSKWREVEDLQGEIPAAALARLDAAHGQLTQALKRGRMWRQFKIISIVGGSVLLLLAAGGWTFLKLRASAHTRMLAELQQSQSHTALRDLVARVKGKESLLLRFGSLATAVSDASLWLETTSDSAGLAEQEIRRLELARETGFNEVPAPELCERLNEAGVLVSKLPAELKNPATARLSVVKGEVERTLLKRQKDNDLKAKKTVEDLNAVLEAVDFKASASSAKESLAGSEKALESYLALAKFAKDPLLRLPTGTEAALQDMDGRLKKVRDQIEAIDHAVESLESATKPDAYRESLKALSECGFKEAAAAKRVLDAWRSDNQVVAFLLFDNNLTAANKAIDKVKNNPEGKELLPSLPLPEKDVSKNDLEVIKELMTSTTLNDLSNVMWKAANGPVRNDLAKGELKLVVAADNNHKFWQGKTRPYPKIIMQKLEFPNEIQSIPFDLVLVPKPLPESVMMKDLDVPGLLNNDGGKYVSSVVPLVDKVINAKDASPLARAYVLSRLCDLIRGREVEWGLDTCREWTDTLDAFDKLLKLKEAMPLQDMSWLLQEKPKNFNLWSAYFNKRKSSLSDSVKATKSAVGSVIGQPLVLAGRVGMDGKVALQAAPVSRLLIGIREVNPGALELSLAGIAGKSPAAFTPATPLVPLSPILCIEMMPTEQEFFKAKHAAPAPQSKHP